MRSDGRKILSDAATRGRNRRFLFFFNVLWTFPARAEKSQRARKRAILGRNLAQKGGFWTKKGAFEGRKGAEFTVFADVSGGQEVAKALG